MTDLKVGVLQADLVWENPNQNRTYFEQQFPSLASQGLDFVVLPEMFTTGFSMQVEKLAETMQGDTVEWLQNCAKKYGFLLTGSLIIQENRHFFNRQIFAFPNGELTYYDKRHLFRMGGEDKHYTAGTERKIITYKGWRICPQICYDLRFPIWSRNREEYDILVYVANFPKPRRAVWNTLLKARAIENQAYVLGCNRIGTDGNSLEYVGDSQIISPKGEVLLQAKEHTACNLVTTLSLSELQEFREKFPTYLDSDDFEIKL